MSFRTRLVLALSLAVVIPLAMLALGVRREIGSRLTGEYHRRVQAAVEATEADLQRESQSVAARVAALAEELQEDNRFRLAAVQDDSAHRGWLLDWGTDALRVSGLAMLQLQDSAGRILSSGHFRNEYHRLRPEILRFLSSAGDTPALLRVRTPEAPFVALARVDTFVVGGRRFALVGGIAAEDRWLGRLAPAPGLAVALILPDSGAAPATGSEIVGALELPWLGLDSDPGERARLVVTQSAGTLVALRRSLDAWFFAALGVTAALALGGSAWLARRISRPLVELAAKTSAIDLDRLDQDFTSDRDDEIGALSRLLGAMTARLRAGAVRLREMERRAAMGDLARQVNHDIKNGLIPIRNVLRHLDQTAREHPERLGEVFQERRGTLESSAAHLETLARNYARLTPAASPEPCDVNALIADVVGGAGERVHLSLSDGLPLVAADRLRLRRVIENLVGNAVESLGGADQGGVSVATEQATRDGSGEVIRITVADTGPGMTRAQLDRAFDDFFTTKPGGTGLGLSIVRRLVLDLGGTLRIATEPGAGTRAMVELPVSREKGSAR